MKLTECAYALPFASLCISQSSCHTTSPGLPFNKGDSPGPTTGHLHRSQTPLSSPLLVRPPLAHPSPPGRQEMKKGWVSGSRCTRQWWVPGTANNRGNWWEALRWKLELGSLELESMFTSFLFWVLSLISEKQDQDYEHFHQLLECYRL